jgi:hypothetical protein
VSNTGSPTPPPAVYPTALKVFTTYQDYTDTIWAVSVNEIHSEVYAIESTLGTNPFYSTPYSTFSGAIQDLYLNKAPATHQHAHNALLQDNVGDDHEQYIRTDGTRAFTGPVGGQNAVAGNQLVPLRQLQGLGYINTGQAQAIIDGAVATLLRGAWGGPPLGQWGPTPAQPNWTLKGGSAQVCTNGSGIVTVSFGSAFISLVQAFIATKIPAPGGQGCPPYNHIEAQLTLVGVSLSTVSVQFSHDYSWQPGMWVAFNWLAIGY